MPQKKKNKAKIRTNVLPTTATFAKKKVKVGKILKKTNTTDTRIQTRKVVLMEQLKSTQLSVPLSHRGLTLEDLCRRLGHYSEVVCRDAIIDVKEMLVNNTSLIAKNLRTIIPCVGRLISAGMKEDTTKSQLKALLRVIFDGISANVMGSHFGLLMSHVLTALTDIRFPVKFFAFDVLLAMLRHFPVLATRRIDAFDCFLKLLGSERRPMNITLLRDAISLFRSVYGTSMQLSLWELKNEVQINVEKQKLLSPVVRIRPSRAAIHFPVLYPTLASATPTGNFTESEARLARLEEIAARLKIFEDAQISTKTIKKKKREKPSK